jgi:hypothetical protein
MFNQTPDDGSQPTEGGSSTMKKFGTAVIVLLLLGSAGAAGFYYKQYDDLKKNPNKVVQDETKALLANIGKLIVLPEGEQPTIATVTDPEKLKEQAFFNNAQTGDKVLIYTNARKAILYSPTQNKIIEVAPVNIGNTAAANNNISGTTTENNDANQ